MKIIGQFAKENNVTVRALHHYEKMGLLTPEKIDNLTGYRYYGVNQQKDIELILLYKDLGFSLSEIKRLIHKQLSTDEFITFVTSKQQQASIDFTSANQRYLKLRDLLKVLNSTKDKTLDYKEILLMSDMNVNVTKYARGDFNKIARNMMQDALLNQTPLCAVQIDIDRFADINKKHGYEVGDIVIERTLDTIIDGLMSVENASVLERKGGDEFSFLISMDLEETVALTKKIVEAVKLIDFTDVSEGITHSISAGVSLYKNDHESISFLIHEATTQLFEAKQTGTVGTVKFK